MKRDDYLKMCADEIAAKEKAHYSGATALFYAAVSWPTLWPAISDGKSAITFYKQGNQVSASVKKNPNKEGAQERLAYAQQYYDAALKHAIPAASYGSIFVLPIALLIANSLRLFRKARKMRANRESLEKKAAEEHARFLHRMKEGF